MNFVVLCASIWFLYGNRTSMDEDYTKYATLLQENACGPIEQATDQEVKYYQSDEYNHEQLIMISDLDTPRFNKEKQEDGNEMQKTAAQVEQEEKTVEDSNTNHDRYDIVYTGNHTWKLVRNER